MEVGYSVPKPIALALFITRILSPSVVLLATGSLIFSRPSVPASPSPITSVVVATRIPRRAAILSLLSLASLTFLFDGLSFVSYAVWDKYWPECTGIEISAIVGIIAFSGLAVLGSWKELHGVKVWDLKRLTASIALALILDIAVVAVSAITTELKEGCEYLRVSSTDVVLNANIIRSRSLLPSHHDSSITSLGVPRIPRPLFDPVVFCPCISSCCIHTHQCRRRRCISQRLILPPSSGRACIIRRFPIGSGSIQRSKQVRDLPQRTPGHPAFRTYHSCSHSGSVKSTRQGMSVYINFTGLQLNNVVSV